MKRISTLLSALVLTTALVSAQRTIVGGTTVSNTLSFTNGEKALDTIVVEPIFGPDCGPTEMGILYNTANSEGTISGTNSLGDKEKAVYVGYTGGGNLLGTLAFFGLKKNGPGAGLSTYTAKIYGPGPSGPNALIGTSIPVPYANLDTTGSPTPFLFLSPVAITSDSFYIAITVDGGPLVDTVSIISRFNASNPPTYVGDCAMGTSWERYDNNSWHVVKDGWGVDMQFLIAGVLEVDDQGVGINENAAVGMHNVFPNPAFDVVNLAYTLNTASDVTISITDLSGKVIASYYTPNQAGGTYNKVIDASGYAAGFYTYTIAANGTAVSKKFVVQ